MRINEVVDHITFDLYDLLMVMGLKNPVVYVDLSEGQCAVSIGGMGKFDLGRIEVLVKTDLKLYGVANADSITVTVMDNRN